MWSTKVRLAAAAMVAVAAVIVAAATALARVLGALP